MELPVWELPHILLSSTHKVTKGRTMPAYVLHPSLKPINDSKASVNAKAAIAEAAANECAEFMQQDAESKRAELKPQQDAELKLQQDAELKPQQDAELKPQQDAELKLQQGGKSEPVEDTEIKPFLDAICKPQDAKSKSQLDAETKPQLGAESKRTEHCSTQNGTISKPNHKKRDSRTNKGSVKPKPKDRKRTASETTTDDLCNDATLNIPADISTLNSKIETVSGDGPMCKASKMADMERADGTKMADATTNGSIFTGTVTEVEKQSEVENERNGLLVANEPDGEDEVRAEGSSVLDAGVACREEPMLVTEHGEANGEESSVLKHSGEVAENQTS